MHQEVEERESFDRPIIYIVEISIDKRGKNSIVVKVKFSDDSEEMHRGVNYVTVQALQHWMENKVPLHRVEGGTLVEADMDVKHHEQRMFDFFQAVFDERIYSANKFALGDLNTLDETDDLKNGVSDFVVYITNYASRWFDGFPPHDAQDLERFRECMVKVANLAYAGHSWAKRRLDAIEIEQQAKAVAASRVKEGN